jgi:hypothetical protein
MPVLLRITVAPPDGHPAASDLYRWLADAPGLAGDVEVRFMPAADPAAAGALGDLSVIQAVVSDVAALGGLLVAVATWRGARSPRARTRVECGTTSVTVTGNSPEEVNELLRRLAAGNSGAGPGLESTGAAGPDGAAGPVCTDVGSGSPAVGSRPAGGAGDEAEHGPEGTSGGGE